MTDTQRSPYTGRPIDHWLDEDIQLHDRDGDNIGKVVEINPDFIVAESDGGFLGLGEQRIYYVPRNEIQRDAENDWYLGIDKDQLESMGWTEPPRESEWSRDWNQGGEQYDYAEQYRAGEPAERRSGTRLRRYEEDLQADTVQRQDGEVVIEKNVVEDTKTIDVPVRREEVHVERQPVSANATSRENLGDEQAFAGDSIHVPVMEEEVEVRKVARPVEEIEVNKTTTQDTRQVEGTVRREEFDIEDETNRR